MSEGLLKSIDKALGMLPRDLLGHIGDKDKEVLCEDRKALREWIKVWLRFVLEALGEDKKAAEVLAKMLPEPCFWREETGPEHDLPKKDYDRLCAKEKELEEQCTATTDPESLRQIEDKLAEVRKDRISWHEAQEKNRKAREKWVATFFGMPAVWLWMLWLSWNKRAKWLFENERTDLPAISGLPDWPGLDHLSQPEPSDSPAHTAIEGATPSQHFLGLMTLILYARIKTRPGEVLDYLRRALEDVKADLALAVAAQGGAERDLSVETDTAKDAEVRGVEAFAGFLGRVLNHAEDLAGELRPAVQPTYPLDTAAITLVQENCAALRWLLSPVILGSGSHDLDALSGYGVKPSTLLSFFAVSPNRDAQRAAKWLLGLVERIDRDITTEQRPTAELVQELEGAAALLRGGKSRAEVARDLIEAIDDLVSYVKDHHNQHLNYFGEVTEQLHPRGVRVHELASALDLASRERPVYNTYGEMERDDSEDAIVRIHLMRNPTWPGWAVKEGDRPWYFAVMPVDGHPWYEEMAALRLKAGVILTEEQERGQSRSKAKKKTKGRMKREVAEPFILEHLMRRPHDTAEEVRKAVGCSVGVVIESSAWMMNRTRLKIAKKEGKDPKAVKLDPKAFTEAGGNPGTQRREAKRQQQALDEEIDRRECELRKRIGEYQKQHPDAAPQKVAQAVGCTAGEVERRQTVVDRLTVEQEGSAKEDGGGRLLDEVEPGVDRSKAQQWLRKRP